MPRKVCFGWSVKIKLIFFSFFFCSTDFPSGFELTMKTERASSVSPMLTPPHTPIEEKPSATNLSRAQHIYEMELLRQRSNPLLAAHPSAYYHHIQPKHENPMAAFSHMPQLPLNVQQYHQQQHRLWLQTHAPNMQVQSSYTYQVNKSNSAP